MRQNALSRRKKMILGGILAFLLSLIVILLTVRYYMYDEDYYRSRFVKYNIYKTNPDADATAHAVILYLKGESDNLNDVTVFSQEEKNHFSDVRDLVYKATLFLYVLISLALLLFLFLLNKLWKYAFPYFACVAMMTGGCMLFFVAIVFLMMLNFPFFFDIFHSLFFEAGSWVFSAEATVVTIFPIGFFVDITARIFLFILVYGALFLIAGGIVWYMERD